MDDLIKAIKAKCLDCSGGSQKNVDTCTIKDCPLYGYRKGAAPATERRRAEARKDKPLQQYHTKGDCII